MKKLYSEEKELEKLLRKTSMYFFAGLEPALKMMPEIVQILPVAYDKTISVINEAIDDFSMTVDIDNQTDIILKAVDLHLIESGCAHVGIWMLMKSVLYNNYSDAQFSIEDVLIFQAIQQELVGVYQSIQVERKMQPRNLSSAMDFCRVFGKNNIPDDDPLFVAEKEWIDNLDNPDYLRILLKDYIDDGMFMNVWEGTVSQCVAAILYKNHKQTHPDENKYKSTFGQFFMDIAQKHDILKYYNPDL